MSESSAALSVSTTFYAPRQYSAPVALSSSYQTSTTSTSTSTSGRALSTFVFCFFLKDRSRQVRALSEQHCVPKPPCFECGEELKRERKRGEDGSLSFFFSRRAQGAPGLVSEALIGVNTLQMHFMQKKHVLS